MIGENLLAPEPALLPQEHEVEAALAEGTAPEAIVRDHPASPLAWAVLADRADADGREIESYAFARVGYHRGLDALRRAGWKGAGPVPWSHEPNRGFLRSVAALSRAAGEIGETPEQLRCAQFLRDSSPEAADALGFTD